MSTGVTFNPIFIKSLVNVTKSMHTTMQIDDILGMFAKVFEQLLPDALICIRLLKRSSEQLDLVYANGRLLNDDRDIFKITKASLVGLELSQEQKMDLFSNGNIKELDQYKLIFKDAIEGFCFLLFDRKRLYGIVNFEYSVKSETLKVDRGALIPFVHLLVASLRNARLIKESMLLKEYWEKLLYSANAPVVAVDRDGVITMLNKRFENMTGMSRDEIVGTEFSKIISSDQRARVLPYMHRAIAGDPINNLEMRFPIISQLESSSYINNLHTARMAHIAFNSAPIHNDFGLIEAVIFVGQDLTLINDLQRQIIHSEKLATLGQLAAGVAHELNNPLTSITVYTNYLLQKLSGVIDSSDIKKLESILYGATRIQSFAKDLVSYARPSEDNPELLSVLQIVKRSVSFCEPIIAKTFASVTIDISNDLPGFIGIESQMEQVFVNIITNACHALGDKNKNVIITANYDNDIIWVSVKDDGKGISHDNLKKVFDPFFTTKDVGKGTGLGLSIVKNIVENHNGEIIVKSNIGEGAEFILKFHAKM